MSRTEQVAIDMRQAVTESRLFEFVAGLSAVRTVILVGVCLLAAGLATLVAVTVAFTVGNLTPFKPLLAGAGALALTVEGFSVVVVSSELTGLDGGRQKSDTQTGLQF